MEEKLYLNLVNTTTAPQQVSLFNNPFTQVNTTSATNAQPKYEWDVTSFTFTSEQTVSIEYKLVGAASFTTVSDAIVANSIDGVVSALNGLNIGTFYTYSSGGSVFISVYSEVYVYQNLNIYDSINVNVQMTLVNGDVLGVGTFYIKASGQVGIPPPNGFSYIGIINSNNSFVATPIIAPSISITFEFAAGAYVKYFKVYQNGALIDAQSGTYTSAFNPFAYTANAGDIFEIKISNTSF